MGTLMITKNRWQISSVWFWSFFISLALDMVVYDSVVAIIQAFGLRYRFLKYVAGAIIAVRACRIAGLQE